MDWAGSPQLLFTIVTKDSCSQKGCNVVLNQHRKEYSVSIVNTVYMAVVLWWSMHPRCILYKALGLSKFPVRIVNIKMRYTHSPSDNWFYLYFTSKKRWLSWPTLTSILRDARLRSGGYLREILIQFKTIYISDAAIRPRIHHCSLRDRQPNCCRKLDNS